MSDLLCLLFCVCLVCLCAGLSEAVKAETFDIVPFALPNCAAGELRFEEPRDISRVVVTFSAKPTGDLSVSYLHKTWPENRFERDFADKTKAIAFGWAPIDDQFNSKWRKAEAQIAWSGARTAAITFSGLTKEFPEYTDYDVAFRRTLGIRIDTKDSATIKRVQVYTVSKPVTTGIRVELDAGAPTHGKQINLSVYNAHLKKLTAVSGVAADGSSVKLESGKKRVFDVLVSHMKPVVESAYDAGMVTFALDDDTFTISLESLAKDGPIWFAEEGVYITRADDPTTFADYQKRIAGQHTISELVASYKEQSLGGALSGQPRPHPDAFHVGCKNARQRFRIEPNGDIVMAKSSMDWVAASDTPRYKNKGNCRFFFGLENWITAGRFADPLLAPVYNINLIRDGITMEQKSLAVPLLKQVSDELIGDDTIVALVRFRFHNNGPKASVAELPLSYSNESDNTYNSPHLGGHSAGGPTDYNVPKSQMDKLSVSSDATDPSVSVISGAWHDRQVVRCTAKTSMQTVVTDKGILLRKALKPGETCDVVLKVPYIELEAGQEMQALAKLDFEQAYAQVCDFWVKEESKGAQLRTPEPKLNALYKAHPSHVMITDFSMPNEPYLINTSVGSSTYANYTNESCMIIQELDERGLHDEARRRLSVWLKYQGTVGLVGNFSDHDGVFFGCGGFEGGPTYDQHHGWALWALCEHYFLTRGATAPALGSGAVASRTRDDAWFKGIAGQIVKGVDWVFRQRKLTMTKQPHSRGWEYGFLPAGSLEDVDDYFFWLSTNAMTYRGVDRAAMALEAIDHPDAARVRAEADAYLKDLKKGFETMRQQTPLARLRDGRWIPTYPSRLYMRGRDVGWIRELLEGSVYLILGGLYDENSKQAKWILDDYQDNRYMGPGYGYPIYGASDGWYDFGGFSCQPTLLAGLLPYLDRDEPEVYIWMFFNSFATIYREEVNAMVEHPYPILGYSNGAIIKTSDQSNSIKWLRYMYVYAPADTLYLGRAIPRDWFTDGREISVDKVSTRFGEVSVAYKSEVSKGKITLTAGIPTDRKPAKILARLRHPEKLPIKSVTVNGQPYTSFDPVKGDVDITGLSGEVVIEARY